MNAPGHRLLLFIVIAAVVVLPATACSQGFFTTAFEEGRWWLIDPDGNRFFSAGCNCVNPSGDFAPDLNTNPYGNAVDEIYESDEAWAEATATRLRDWGFNTIGAWSTEDLFAGAMPYTIILYVSGSDWQGGNVPDYFSLEHEQRVAEAIEAHVVPHADDPYLIGYFYDNEIRWGPDWRGLEDMFVLYFAMPADAPGKQALVGFLEERYHGNVRRFNTIWNMSIANFDDLLTMTKVRKLSSPLRRADRNAFTEFVARRFYSVAHDAIRSVDPNHLILGARFVNYLTPEPVVRAIIDYTDVVSVNHYWIAEYTGWWLNGIGQLWDAVNPEDQLARYYELTNKPILIGEFGFRALDSGLPNNWPPRFIGLTPKTQDERADLFEEYIRQTYAGGFVVGAHWFQYMDQPETGRFDGENNNYGLVTINDEPWKKLTDRTREVLGDALVWPIPETHTLKSN